MNNDNIDKYTYVSAEKAPLFKSASPNFLTRIANKVFSRTHRVLRASQYTHYDVSFGVYGLCLPEDSDGQSERAKDWEHALRKNDGTIIVPRNDLRYLGVTHDPEEANISIDADTYDVKTTKMIRKGDVFLRYEPQ